MGYGRSLLGSAARTSRSHEPVQQALGGGFVDYPEVRIEVGAIGFEVVVDGSKAGSGEAGVNHGRLRPRSM